MERSSWVHEYKRLLTAFGKKTNTEQSAEYFLALQPHTGACVHDAITSAIRESKYWPTPADLVERAKTARHNHQVPVSACDVCHGSTWTQHPCDGVTHADGGLPIRPINPSRFCGHGDIVHQWHDYARRCYQCWQPMEQAS